MTDKPRQPMPAATIETVARSVFEQAASYGFTRLDHVRLASALLSLCNADPEQQPAADSDTPRARLERTAAGADPEPPLASSQRLSIGLLAGAGPDQALVASWLHELFSAHFLFSAATAQTRELDAILADPRNVLGLIRASDGQPIGVTAFLDCDDLHRKAEIRILIAAADRRNQGYGLEAARTWLQFGFEQLDLEKIYVQLLASDVRSLHLFERLGFSVEAVLPGELRVAGVRQDAARCGLLRDQAPAAERLAR